MNVRAVALRRQPDVSALENGHTMGRGQRLIQLAHFQKVEVFRTSSAEQNEWQRFAWLGIGIAGAGRNHAGHPVGVQGDAHGYPRASRHAGCVDAFLIHLKVGEHVVYHRLGSRHTHSPRPVLRIVRTGHNVAELLRGSLVDFNRNPAAGSRVERENHRPPTLRSVAQRYV